MRQNPESHRRAPRNSKFGYRSGAQRTGSVAGFQDGVHATQKTAMVLTASQLEECDHKNGQECKCGLHRIFVDVFSLDLSWLSSFLAQSAAGARHKSIPPCSLSWYSLV